MQFQRTFQRMRDCCGAVIPSFRVNLDIVLYERAIINRRSADMACDFANPVETRRDEYKVLALPSLDPTR